MIDLAGRSAKKMIHPSSLVSLLLTAMIVIVLIFFGPAGAVDIDFSVGGHGSNEIFEEAEDELIAESSLDINIGDSEHVPLYNFTLEITSL